MALQPCARATSSAIAEKARKRPSSALPGTFSPSPRGEGTASDFSRMQLRVLAMTPLQVKHESAPHPRLPPHLLPVATGRRDRHAPTPACTAALQCILELAPLPLRLRSVPQASKLGSTDYCNASPGGRVVRTVPRRACFRAPCQPCGAGNAQPKRASRPAKASSSGASTSRRSPLRGCAKASFHACSSRRCTPKCCL